MALVYLGYTPDPAHADLDALWTLATNGDSNAALALIDAAAALALATTAEANAQTAITNAAAAQATANTALGNTSTALSIYNVKASPYLAVGNGVADDTAAIQAASDACNAAGGGILYFPQGSYKITADVTVTRKVSVRGAGPTVTGITTAVSKKFSCVGPALSWAGWVCEDLAFTRVELTLGTLVGDEVQGSEVLNCIFFNCTNGIYFGFNAFFTTVDRCKFIDCTNGVLTDFATGGYSSGASMRFTNCEAHDSAATGLAHVGFKFLGTSNPSVYIDRCEFERLTIASVEIDGGDNRSFYTIRDSDHQLNTATCFHIINDGAVVFVDGFQSFSASEAAWFNLSGGRTFLSRVFGNWLVNQFAKITGGVLTVDLTHYYCPARPWGSGTSAILVAGSSTAGKVVAPRNKVVTMSRVNSKIATVDTPMTDATPTADAISIAVPGDGNEHYYEFDLITSAAVGTDNRLRCQFADGLTSINLDLILPLFVGVGRVRMTWFPGGVATATCVYSGGTPGATTTIGVSASGADTFVLSQTKFLTFSSIKTGATAATMQVKNLVEEVCGPYTADT